MADPALAPAGVYTQEALETLGLWDSIQPKLIYGPDVRTALQYAATGDVDAAIVYASDASNADGIRELWRFSAASHQPVTYPAAVLAESGNRGDAPPSSPSSASRSRWQSSATTGSRRPRAPARQHPPRLGTLARTRYHLCIPRRKGVSYCQRLKSIPSSSYRSALHSSARSSGCLSASRWHGPSRRPPCGARCCWTPSSPSPLCFPLS